jgi:hypothetical protein
MVSPKGIRAGAAFVEIFADDSKLVRGLAKARTQLRSFGKSVSQIGDGIKTAGTWMLGPGTAIVAPMIAATKTFTETGHALTMMSERTGVSVEALSELQYAAGQSGVEMDALEKSIRLMQKVIGGAASGSATATAALTGLGLSVKDLVGMNPEDQFMAVASAVSKIENPTLKVAAALKVFGRGGAEILPLLKDGAGGIEAFRAEAQRLGVTISTEEVAAAEAFHQTLGRLWAVIRRVTVEVGAALTPTLTEFAGSIISAAQAAGKWIKDNHEIVALALKIGAVVAGVGLAFIAVGTVLSSFGGIFTGIAAAITIVTTIIPIVAAVIGALLTPVGLVIGAVAAVVIGLIAVAGYALYSSGALGRAWDWIMDKTKALREDFSAAFGAMWNLLKAGDWGGAAKVLWLTLKMEWARGVEFLTDIWVGWKQGFLDIFTDAYHSVAKIWNVMIAALSDPWETFTAALSIDWIALQKLMGAITPEEAAAKYDQWTKDHSKVAPVFVGQEEDDAAYLDRERHSIEASNDRAAAAKEFADARKAWQDKVDDANAYKVPDDEEAYGAKGRKSPIAAAAASMEDIQRKVGISGSFNASAAWGLVGTGSIDRVAKASEEPFTQLNGIRFSWSGGEIRELA